ncbi:hypothetical protein [Flavobacterium sp. JP2137]|uniref:hypothetical protein n=1 Tax=Flavobacterium sp. JP2137 TaxID=3414510 RepID=UPI003D2FAC46
MKKVLFTLLILIGTSSCGVAQNKSAAQEKTPTQQVEKQTKKAPTKIVEKDNVCLLTQDDEIRSLAEGKISHPSSLPRIKKEIAELTSCGLANIKIISGKESGNTAEYIACVCGTKMIYKVDYSMKIKTINEL